MVRYSSGYRGHRKAPGRGASPGRNLVHRARRANASAGTSRHNFRRRAAGMPRGSGVSRRARRAAAANRKIRGAGLMFGIQLARSGNHLVNRALERGLLLNCTHDIVLRLLPPYILSSEQAEDMLRILDDVLAV